MNINDPGRPLKYHEVQVKPGNEKACPVCLEGFKNNGEVIAHEGAGVLHPIHKECAKEWHLTYLKCPTCREEVSGEWPEKKTAFTTLYKGVELAKSILGRTIDSVGYGLSTGWSVGLTICVVTVPIVGFSNMMLSDKTSELVESVAPYVASAFTAGTISGISAGIFRFFKGTPQN